MSRYRFLVLCICAVSFASCQQKKSQADEVIEIIHKVNNYWQTNNPKHGNSFWHRAAYHTGNMEAYHLTKEPKYLEFSQAWAEHNEWKGAKSDNKEEWKYTYGETNEYVLFGDFQTCFQVYADLYNLEPADYKIARAREVMEYQMGTDYNGYWWWADGLYMVMPVMTRLYKITENPLYLEKLHEYLAFADSIMYDAEAGLYYRDAKYVYPKHKSVNGKKDFWARGDGWVLAAFARVLQDLPENDKYRDEYIDRFRTMAKAVAASQQPDGYWTRSMLDAGHAPGPETSGTAFFTYGILWGINNNLLSKQEYAPVVDKAWKYLTTVALQPDGKLGYVQPIGEKAIPGQVVDANSQADFGVGAFLLAATEMARYVDQPKKATRSVPTEQDMAAYLMVYFTDPTHSLFMAVSHDGYSFTSVNNAQPVIAGDTIASQKGIRDPHIYRGPDGAFYLAMTDLHIFGKDKGYRSTQWERPVEDYDWGNNRGFVLMKSYDLITWTRSNVFIQEAFPGLDVGCAWAPQTTYDPVAGKMMIYFTMRLGRGKTKLYYAYTDDEFTRLTSEPRILFEYPDPNIQILDADITHLPDGRYCMMYVAQERPGGIRMAMSDSIHTGYQYDDRWIDVEPGACEAPNVWKRIGEDKWVLMYDIFSVQPHNFGFCETPDFTTFNDLGHFNAGVMKTTNFTSPKHGAIIQITAEEASRLEKHYSE